MIFHFEINRNEVRTNSILVVLTSSCYGYGSTPINENNFRRAIALYICRTGNIIDNRKYENWHKTSDKYLAPKIKSLADI
ncbi:hypothetical protein EB001_06865 [bacterium]|jgi:hypothetical protein|nr:hypothetical protein [bacterium]